MREQRWIKKGLLYAPEGNRPWMASHAAVPVARHLKENLYRIYFSGRDEQNRSQTGFIEIDITEPNNILHVADEPVLRTGEPGTFNDSGSMASWIVKQGGTEYLYFIGWNLGVTVPFRNSIGLALSLDGGRTFEQYSEAPILDRSEQDPCFVASCCIMVEGGLWRMWYLSCIAWERSNDGLRHRYHIKYAESDDGISWKRDGQVCIDFKSEDEYAISRPCVLKEDGVYKMWYSYRGLSYRIGYAESSDGISWERRDNLVGLDVSPYGWDSQMIEYPFVFDHGGSRYMLYNGNDYGRTGIGLALLGED